MKGNVCARNCLIYGNQSNNQIISLVCDQKLTDSQLSSAQVPVGRVFGDKSGV